MWAIRIIKNVNSNKIESVKLVDEKNLSTLTLSSKEVKAMIKSIPGIISNLELDNYGNLRVSTMTKYRNSKAYSATLRGDYTVHHYCIVTGYCDGLLNWIADDFDMNKSTVLYGELNSLQEIANTLQIRLTELKFFNAYVDKVKKEDFIFLYAGPNTYKQLGAVVIDKKSKVEEGGNWERESIKESDGLRVKYLEHKYGLLDCTLPNGMVYLDKFGGGINNLVLPDSLKVLGDECFLGLNDLYSITLGKGIKDIPYRCFAESKLEEIKFSGFEQVIREEAFADCYKLKGSIVTTAKVICDRAFDMSPISVLKLSNAVLIGKEAFMDTALKQVTLNEGLHIIGASAFRNCEKLLMVDIPYSVARIDANAFAGCKRLREVYVSKHTVLGKNVFPKHTRVILK